MPGQPKTHDPRWSKVVRDLTLHPARTALVVLSIAVGVFAIVMVMGGRAIILDSFETNFPASEAAHAVLYTGDFGDLVAQQVARADGVALSESRRSLSARYRTGDVRAADEPVPGSTQAERPMSLDMVASRDWESDRLVKVFPERGVMWPPAAGEVVLEQSAKQITDLKAGDVITLDTEEGDKRKLTVAGFAHDINSFPAMFVNRVAGYVSMDTMGRLGQPGTYNQLLVRYDDPRITRDEASDRTAELRDEVLAPAGVRVGGTWVPEPGSHRLGDIFKALVMLLLALGILALLLSGFLVVNTISALVTQQTKQLGIMKAVGGNAAQITRMYLMLVCAYGLVGTVIGLPAGAYAASWFAGFANGLLNFGEAPSVFPTYALALGLAVGIVVPVGAALVPIGRGARMKVVSALNATGMGDTSFGHHATDRLLGLLRGLPRPVALSLRNTFLRKGRLAMTLITLMLASAVVMAVISVRSSLLRTVDDMSAWWRYDVEVSFTEPVGQAAVEAEVSRVPGVTGVESWIVRGTSLMRPDGSEREGLRIIGVPPDTTFVSPKITDGRWFDPKDKDAVVVNTELAKDEDLEVGETADLKIRGSGREGVERSWRVVGIVRGQLGEARMYAPREQIAQLSPDDAGVGALVVRTSRHSDSFQKQESDRIEDRLSKAGVPVGELDTTKQMSQRIASELGLIVVFLVIMAVLLAAVAVIGLSGTMITNVVESTREIGVMRAVGASHGDIFQVFVTEGMVVGVLAWFLGLLFTYPLSYGLVRLLETAIGMPVSYDFSWAGVGLWLALVMAISAIASLLPAARAAQVSVSDAIAYE